MNFDRSTVVFLAPISRFSTSSQFAFQACANYPACAPNGTWRLLMYSQLACCSSVNPWYTVEVGAGVGVIWAFGGDYVAAAVGARVVGTTLSGIRAMVVVTLGCAIGLAGGVVATFIATWRASMSSADSTKSSASVSASSETDPASEAGAGRAGSFPFLDAVRRRIWGACTMLLEDGLLTSISPRRPTVVAGRLCARLIIFGSDEEGTGVANETLRPALGLRVRRGSSFAGP